MTKELRDELKPCPFCGGEAVYEELHAGHSCFSERVNCPKCKASIKRDWYPGNESEVIPLWNTRAPDPKLLAIMELYEAGYRLAPGEATEEQSYIGEELTYHAFAKGHCACEELIYKTMIAAAPDKLGEILGGGE